MRFLKEGHMSAENQKDSAMSQLDDLFGEPPLIKGEDKARYCRLLVAIEHEIKPETVFDKIRVREIADKLWQQQRCKQNAASLVEGAYVEALASLLRAFMDPPMISMGDDAASKIARDYYSGEAKSKKVKELELLLAQYGITAEQIRAKAMQLCGGGVSMFNRMETHCETSLRMLQKETDRRTADKNAKARGSEEPEARLSNNKDGAIGHGERETDRG
jgi:hypothetical protein